MPKLVIILLVLFFDMNVFAGTKQAIFFGGACESSSVGYEADYFNFYRAAESLKLKNWDMDFKIKADTSKQQILNQLDKAISSAQSGELKQLLIGTLTHGTPETNKHPHAICVEVDKDQERVWMDIDDPAFTSRLNNLKKLGVQIGFMDGSCFSGGSVSALKKYGCVITSQASNRFSWGSGPFEALKRKANDKNVTLSDIWRDNLINDSSSSDGHMQMPTSSEYAEAQDIQEDLMTLLLNGENYEEEGMKKSCYKNGQFLEENLNPFLNSMEKVIAPLLETEYAKFVKENPSSVKNFQDLKKQIIDELKIYKEKIAAYKIKEHELEDFDSGISVNIPFDKNNLQGLTDKQQKAFKNTFKNKFKISINSENNSAKVNLLDIGESTARLKLYKQIEHGTFIKGQMQAVEGINTKDDEMAFLNKASHIIESIPQDLILEAQIKSSKRDSLVDELLSKQREIRTSYVGPAESSPIKLSLAKNIKTFIAFLSSMQEEHVKKGDCSNFKL